jgi:predicted outer membrane repeat protein
LAEGDVTLVGGAQFINNSASPEGKYGTGGAVYVGNRGTLTIGGPVTFKNNSAPQGGAVTTTQSVRFLGSNSSSWWIGNYASMLGGGGALRVQGSGSVLFGTAASHKFGSNRAGSLSSAKEQDIAVLDKGSFQCSSSSSSSSSYSAGKYSVEGNVCSAKCIPGKSGCKCAAAESFVQSKCSCQRRV